ncbi:MAG: hypothetical protein FLDDKLPJ_00283 [Phycisphaerae bacterium]|nr:hypothetical protein [Phycisphaerae bacterium]
MGRRKPTLDEGPSLYEAQERVVRRRVSRQRALFIPRLLTESAVVLAARRDEVDRAHQILLRWADLESSGRLPQHRETSIDGQFLDQVFGEALGYTVKTQNPQTWQLEHQYPVAGVGQADAALGNFPDDERPAVLIELKDANTDLDRDRE